MAGLRQCKLWLTFLASRRKGDVTMLKLIEGSYAPKFPKEMDAMFRNRALTFSERLGWDVAVNDGHERDVFDDANPLYLISVDPETNEYWGSLRLLPTTGPNMLRDIFPYLLGEGEFIESATIWESSRICAVSAEGQPDRSRNGVNLALGELLAGIGEVAIIAGLNSNRLGVRCPDLPCAESRRLQSTDHWKASANRRHYELRWAVRCR